MARSILLIADEGDYESLISYCKELDLNLLPLQLGVPIKSPADGPICYLGHMKESDLHPYGNPPVRIADVRDPLLQFIRPYYSAPYLTDGGIFLNEDVKHVADKIRPTFEKLKRWVKSNWHKTDSHASYIGPNALQLLDSGKATWRSWLHNAEGRIVRT